MMRRAHPGTNRAPLYPAALFVDYQNLYAYLSERLDPRERPTDYILEILRNLCVHLRDTWHAEPLVVRAYADFCELEQDGGLVQRGLYLLDAEPRFVPADFQQGGTLMQLCLDAADLLHARPDVACFVVLTGDRAYLPLVQHLKRHGRQVLVAALSPSPLPENIPYEDGVFLKALGLLSDPMRRRLRREPSPRPDATQSPEIDRREIVYYDITDAGAYEALRVIDEYFGQYDEIYLTPLLRKLSEVLDDDRYDPKALVSTLEDAGAVWLEKRHGFPYDYTVLLVDGEHPDVQALFEDAAAPARFNGYDDEAGAEALGPASDYPAPSADDEALR